jgi:hypothetical protein
MSTDVFAILTGSNPFLDFVQAVAFQVQLKAKEFARRTAA